MKLKNLLLIVFALHSPLVLAQDAQSSTTQQIANSTMSEEEMATLYVLSEICPQLVSNQQQWQQGYANILRNYLPNLKQPASALQQLSQQSQFQVILRQAQQLAQQEGERKNRVICTEITNYV